MEHPGKKRRLSSSTSAVLRLERRSQSPSRPSILTKSDSGFCPDSRTTSDAVPGTVDINQREQQLQQNDVCFGMLLFTTLEVPMPSSKSKVMKLPVKLGDAGDLYSADSAKPISKLAPRDSQLLELFHREAVSTEITLLRAPLESHSGKSLQEPNVRAVLYGNVELAPAIDDVLQDLGLYLQDPTDATRGVRYWNPQRFHMRPEAHTSDWWVKIEPASRREQAEAALAVELAQFTSGEYLNETDGPKYLLTPLKKHQRQALTFMIGRENGWKLREKSGDIWTAEHDSAGRAISHINNIDESTHEEPPPEFRGGIIADHMGSGKTLAMIALMAHDKLHRVRQVSKHKKRQRGQPQVTLIIVPAPLLYVWKDELSRHLTNHSLSWRCHHGSSKLLGVASLQGLDIVLTSYTTLEADWRRYKDSSILFLHSWHRVILDEAHYIKNHRAATAHAACAVRADRRWAVTGTPIQNGVSELQSLFKFLKVFPYSEKAAFDHQISNVWAAGEVSTAISRLKRLLGFVMLRRSSDHIVLPSRKDYKLTLRFEPHELEAYRQASNKALKCLDEILLSDSETRESYTSALHKINALRLLCNIGLSSTDSTGSFAMSSFRNPDHRQTWDSNRAVQTLGEFPLLGLATACTICQASIEAPVTSAESNSSLAMTRCLRLYCSACFTPSSPQSSSSSVPLCSCSPRCPIAEFKLDSNLETPRATSFVHSQGGHSTKIRALIQDLERHSYETKSVVFSFWRATLNSIHTALDEAGISCLQVDGDVKSDTRRELFNKFSTDKGVRVLLLSLSCGAVGLTLTAASRVYLMEPQWNPSYEEQALARIWRIGQTQSVTTIRFIMEDTIEQYVVKMQNKKNDLVSVLLSPQNASLAKMSHRRLEVSYSILTWYKDITDVIDIYRRNFEICYGVDMC
ncbi:SNF2 family N-terminal domain-containing protein [Xylariales sp. PMI_506]|nr:SNF2 family N-terminal domain-containing protein [Xylariales sp. PMI_506]